MNRIPGGKQVNQALKGATKAVQSAQHQVNQYAAKLVTRGDYAGAEKMLAVGRSVAEFQKEVEAIHCRWREVQGQASPAVRAKEPKTPLWRYYAPTLRALIELGGVARRQDIERQIESYEHNPLPDGDLAALGGRPRWKVMVQRSLRAMVKEHFVQLDKKQWKITPAGRKAAEVESAKEPSSK